MKKVVLALMTGAVAYNVLAATPDYWFEQSEIQPVWAKSATVNLTKQSTQQLVEAKLRAAIEQGGDQLLPLPNGHYQRVIFQENQVLPVSLKNEYPQLATFSLINAKTGKAIGRAELTYTGLHASFAYAGKRVVIEPVERAGSDYYTSYYKQDVQQQTELKDKITKRLAQTEQFSARLSNATAATNSTTRTFKLAFSATGEYTAMYGGTKQGGLSAITTMTNRLSEIYFQEFGIQFVMPADADKVIFTDAATDPFTNDDNDIDKNAQVLNDNLGNANYDVGHVININGGGLAALGAVCTTSKADGMSGIPNTNESFIVDYVAHEVGHQFGAEHSFNTGEGSCGSNRAASSAYEPGSGATIMSYAGICGSTDLQNNSEPFFHAISHKEINTFVSGLAADCGTQTTASNQIPTVDAGSDFHVPANTPFKLSGSGNDVDNDTLDYRWEQFDAGDSDADAPKTKAEMVDNGKRPLFRSFVSTAEPVRYLPQMSSVLSGNLVIGETYATTNRELNFRLTARDNKGGVARDDMKVTVHADNGSFALTAPTSSTTWKQGETLTVRWNTAATNQAPYNCSKVDILLSTDNGASFAINLATTENDGEYSATVPNLTTDEARVMVRCQQQIFFNISEKFAINAQGGANQAPVISGQNAISTNEDTAITLTKAMLQFSDPDSNSSSISLQVQAGTNYTVSGTQITPAQNFAGQLTVPVTLSDGQATSNVFNLAVNVTAVNDAPTAQDDSITVDHNAQNVMIDVLANDSDVDSNDTLTLVSVTTSGTGTVNVVDNKVQYSPANGFSGSEQLTYQIKDSAGAQVTANVSITVKAAPTNNNGGNTGGNSSGSSSSGGGSMPVTLLMMMFALVGSRNNKR